MMNCGLCENQTVTLDAIEHHIRNEHIGLTSRMFLCGSCPFEAPDVDRILQHCVQREHAPKLVSKGPDFHQYFDKLFTWADEILETKRMLKMMAAAKATPTTAAGEANINYTINQSSSSMGCQSPPGPLTIVETPVSSGHNNSTVNNNNSPTVPQQQCRSAIDDAAEYVPRTTSFLHDTADEEAEEEDHIEPSDTDLIEATGHQQTEDLIDDSHSKQRQLSSDCENGQVAAVPGKSLNHNNDHNNDHNNTGIGGSNRNSSRKHRSKKSCGFCDKTVRDKHDLRKHREKYHPELKDHFKHPGTPADAHICPTCDQVFPSFAEMETHRLVTHYQEPQRQVQIHSAPDENPSITNPTVKQELEAEAEEENLVSLPEKRALEPDQEQQQQEVGGGGLMMKKRVCTTTARDQSIVDVTDESGKVFCPDCGNRFSTKRSLRIHRVRLHTKEFPYKCQLCDHRGFCFINELQKHIDRAHQSGAAIAAADADNPTGKLVVAEPGEILMSATLPPLVYDIPMVEESVVGGGE